MAKFISYTLQTILTLIIVLYVTNYLLLQDNTLHLSIAAIIAYAHQLAHRQHLLVLGLLPIYIATVVFGTTVCSLFFIRQIKFVLSRSLCKKISLIVRSNPY